jgi:hypothetical protein
VAAGCKDKDDLEGFLEGLVDCYMHIDDDPDGVLVMVINYNLGVIEPYPCSLDDLVKDGEDLFRESCMMSQIESVVDAIAEVEGLNVEIEVDLGLRDESIPASCDRQVSHASSVVLQNIEDYPFDEPFPGDRTVAEWFAERFSPSFPGWKVFVPGRPTMKLDKARQLTQFAAGHEYSNA